MSMLKSLQSIPGIITLYHSSRRPATSLLRTLELEANPTSPPNQKSLESPKPARSLWSYILKGKNEDPGKPKYTLEERKDELPTYNQLKLIRSFVHKSPALLKTFQHSFPQFVSEDFKKVQIPEELECIDLLNEGFDQWVEKGLFNPPLIVDWDKECIANGENSLHKLLATYKDQGSTKSE